MRERKPEQETQNEDPTTREIEEQKRNGRKDQAEGEREAAAAGAGAEEERGGKAPWKRDPSSLGREERALESPPR